MPAFYLTLLAVLLSGIGARDQGVVATLSLRQQRRPAILVMALATSLACAGLAAFAAHTLLESLPPPARMIFAAIALGLAGAESLLLGPVRAWKEPTHSLGALGLVLLAHQIGDAARFVIFGLGVGMAAPVVSGLAGFLGGAVLLGFAWAFPQEASRPRWRLVRRGAGGALLLAALYLLIVQMRIL
ncbi:hypothetical protein [Novosphingobium decolorationis]|uniref:GDT1 family protein n=1 Tax=Novosphingobium decolorationis TaxID=2698673 RepID=A0ABX8E444_9SPHN|nr:hypothetical protein [Novosphingobium decolorationis]QVM83695.1 hypothetical protein HT578_08295 [Novosphingobium decolorationis]